MITLQLKNGATMIRADKSLSQRILNSEVFATLTSLYFLFLLWKRPEAKTSQYNVRCYCCPCGNASNYL